ncbi:hypothetical protein [Terasakiella sp. SH-1]|uniref:hypothetical protein n=1 Tax=Terasakiella sp. SH-1 TaxID=2560057 RepID=UPI001073C310|nr:hypothetical protein [Terasakiella sp. SH-1]
MTQVRNQEELQEWLVGRGRWVAAGLAARIGLRVLPKLELMVSLAPTKNSTLLLLPVFRALAVPWIASSRPSDGPEFSAAGDIAAASSRKAAGDGRTIARALARTKSKDYGETGRARAAVADAAAAAAKAAVRTAIVSAIRTVHRALATGVDVWPEINRDIALLEDGAQIEQVMNRPLWGEDMPEELKVNWQSLKQSLLALDEDWWVWTQWYEDRLEGGAKPNGRSLIYHLEKERALIPKDKWKKGAAHFNAVIAEIEEKYRGKPPVDEVAEQRQASVQTEYHEDGLLHRRPPPAPALKGEAQEGRLRVAWQSHLHMFEDLAELQPGRNYPAVGNFLKRYQAALGVSFDELNVIALGTQGLRLQNLADSANDFFLEDAVAEIKALKDSHHLFIRQFQDWLDYLDDAGIDIPQEAIEDSKDVLEETEHEPELFAEDLRAPVHDLLEEVDTNILPDPEDRIQLSDTDKLNLVRVVGNIFSGLFEPLFPLARKAQKTGVALSGPLLDFGKKVVKFVKSPVVISLLTGGAVAVAQELGWIKPIADLILSVIK